MPDLVDHVECIIQRFGVEEYPAETYKVKSDQHCNSIVPPFVIYFPVCFTCQQHPNFMDRQRNPMHGAPDNKVPVGPMPETTEQHGGKQVQVGGDACFILPDNGWQYK